MALNTRYSLGYTAPENRAVTPVPCWALKLVPKPTGTNETVKNGNEDVLKDTMPLIQGKIRRTLHHTQKLAPKLKGTSLEDTARADWNFIFDHIKYVRDKKGSEQVRSPRRLIWEGKGDCDCFTVTLSSFLHNQGIPHKLRIMKAPGETNWSHIYVIVPLDGDLKKKLTSSNQYLVLDPVTHSFNYEAPHSTTKDFPMALEYLDGLGMAAAQGTSCPTLPLSQRLRRFVPTDDVVLRGYIPTREFLSQNNIVATEKVNPETNAGYFEIVVSHDSISVPKIINVPTVMTPDQAAQLLNNVAQDAAPASQESQPAQASIVGSDNNWIWYLVLIGLGTMVVFGEDETTTTPSALGAVKKKRLKSYSL